MHVQMDCVGLVQTGLHCLISSWYDLQGQQGCVGRVKAGSRELAPAETTNQGRLKYTDVD